MERANSHYLGSARLGSSENVVVVAAAAVGNEHHRRTRRTLGWHLAAAGMEQVSWLSRPWYDDSSWLHRCCKPGHRTKLAAAVAAECNHLHRVGSVVVGSATVAAVVVAGGEVHYCESTPSWREGTTCWML